MISKYRAYFSDRTRSIFWDIMEEAGLYGDDVWLESQEDFGSLNRMENIWIA